MTTYEQLGIFHGHAAVRCDGAGEPDVTADDAVMADASVPPHRDQRKTAIRPFTPNGAVSFQVMTDDQAETDRYWNAIIENGGSEGECSWCKDRWGFSWQIVPRALIAALKDPDRAAAKRAMDAMMTMRRIDIAKIEACLSGYHPHPLYVGCCHAPE